VGALRRAAGPLRGRGGLLAPRHVEHLLAAAGLVGQQEQGRRSCGRRREEEGGGESRTDPAVTTEPENTTPQRERRRNPTPRGEHRRVLVGFGVLVKGIKLQISNIVSLIPSLLIELLQVLISILA